MAEVRDETLDPAKITTHAGDAATGELDARRVALLAQIHVHLGAQIERPLVCPTGNGGYAALRHAALIDAARRTGGWVDVLVVDADDREAAALCLAFTGHAMSTLDRIYHAGCLLGILGAGSQRLAPYTVRDVADLMTTSRETVNADLKPRAELLAREVRDCPRTTRPTCYCVWSRATPTSRPRSAPAARRRRQRRRGRAHGRRAAPARPSPRGGARPCGRRAARG